MTATRAQRMATARQALERAEAAAGVRTRLVAPVRRVDDVAGRLPEIAPGSQPVASVPADDGERPHVVAAGTVPGPAGVSGTHGGEVADHVPVPAALAGFFPPAGLRRGSVVQVGGSSSLLLALLAAAQGEGWVALAALPDIGLQAAAEAGLALERSLLVPRPGPEAASVVGALVDGVDVLAVGDCRALNARDRRLLSARLRSRGAVLLSTGHWPGADVVLRAGEARTDGLGRGWGRVAAAELTVHGRGRSGVAGRVRVRIGSGGLGTVGGGGLSLAGGLGSVGNGGPGSGDEAVLGPVEDDAAAVAPVTAPAAGPAAARAPLQAVS